MAGDTILGLTQPKDGTVTALLGKWEEREGPPQDSGCGARTPGSVPEREAGALSRSVGNRGREAITEGSSVERWGNAQREVAGVRGDPNQAGLTGASSQWLFLWQVRPCQVPWCCPIYP